MDDEEMNQNKNEYDNEVMRNVDVFLFWWWIIKFTVFSNRFFERVSRF